MKIVQIQFEGQRWIGLLEQSVVRLLQVVCTDLPVGACQFIESWTSAENGIQHRSNRTLPVLTNLDGVEFLAPVERPQKIICVGRNYADHASEMGSEIGEWPVIFNKFPTTIAADNEPITLPPISSCVDFEAELVVVIGRKAKNVSIDKAMEHVFGYCCGNDISARDWQKGKPGGQWLLGKTFDGFAPIGPCIVTPDEIDPGNLEISLHLNGNLMQKDSTANLLFKIDFLISHISDFCTLMPGDLIFTGTPAGVGAGRNPPVYLSPGDETVVEISGIGKLRNRFVTAN